MSISIYHVDAFADTVFHGNPAAVCVLSKRGGDVICRYENNRLLKSGKAVLYMRGFIFPVGFSNG